MLKKHDGMCPIKLRAEYKAEPVLLYQGFSEKYGITPSEYRKKLEN